MAHGPRSAKFIGPSDRQDKDVIGLICLISSRTELSDVVSKTMYIMYSDDSFIRTRLSPANTSGLTSFPDY